MDDHDNNDASSSSAAERARLLGEYIEMDDMNGHTSKNEFQSTSASGENLNDAGNAPDQQALWDASVVDPVLAKKMALVNQAIDQIGMTGWHWKLFFLNGFGYFVDSLLVVCQSIAMPAVTQEYGSPDAKLKGIALASQIGLLVGAAVWGFSADVIGRRLAFNSSLFICAVFVLIAGGMPDYISFATMVAIYSAAAGGGYIIDATNLFEFLPRSHAWLVTFMGIWVPLGYGVTGLFAWAYMSNFSCESTVPIGGCPRSQNWGWRYLHFTAGGLVLALSIIRVFLIKMVHTPRWLVSQNRDDEVYHQLIQVSEKYSRPFDLELETLRSQGRVLHTEKSAWSSLRLYRHFSGLFETRALAYSTTIIIANWFVIGTVGPLYQAFLPYYLASRGAKVGDGSNYTTWRNYAINQAVGLIGPVIAGVLIEVPRLGRRGTLAVGAAITTAFQFAYTQIKTPAQNIGVSSAITASSNIYWAVIYHYTPEILPSAHRATGYGVCTVMNRVGGIVGVLVGSYADVETTAPLFVCASLFALLIVLSLMLPFETQGKRSL
ncbi:Major facilitator-type transporter hxnZ [Pseudocercospora fuligena]|uniref:Major facilitator-type transporter hxnZ n=1 Tax=Pseudocercospora fuligena TaxID=685502 RepID=A0A8H6VJG9_9PEZI|nr:Major facilitator-type transporter hxnZ [Pseudocercospora fuligena]